MIFSDGDICDRLTIELNKSDYFKRLWEELYWINAAIWEQESNIKQGKLDNNPTKAGLAIIQIRKKSMKRIEIKNKITRYFHDHPEMKVDYLTKDVNEKE